MGYGHESPELFNSSEPDCWQWAKICKEAGMKGIILLMKNFVYGHLTILYIQLKICHRKMVREML